MLWPYLLLLAAFASASDRSDKLAKLTAAGSVLRLNSATYDEFTAGARDYSLSVVLTALGPQFKCQPCQQFQPAHREVARQFRRKARQPDHKHFFAYLDFPDGQETFRKLGLNSAPIAHFFPANADQPASAKSTPEIYDFRMGVGAPEFSRWLASQLPGSHFSYSQPINWSGFATSAGMLCIIAFSAYRNWAQLAPFLLGRYLWAAASVGVVLLMISGRMWVQIRNAPFAARDGYIAGGYSNQYGIEVYIIAAIYAVLAFAAYTIAVILPQNKNPSIQRIGVYVWCAVLVSVHSILVSIFKTKNPGYPFSFLW